MIKRCAEELQWAKLQWEVSNYIMKRQGNQACHKSKTGEGLGVPNGTVRNEDLDDEKRREEVNLCI